MTTDPDLIICDILQTELGLDSQHVAAFAQNWRSPKDSGLYVSVEPGVQKTNSVVTIFDPTTQEENQSISVVQEFIITITSKDRSAFQRKEEVLMALASTYSVQQQEAQGVKITRGTDPVDLSFIEGASALKRYEIRCNMFYLKTKTASVPYFDTFQSAEALTQNG